MHLLVSTASLGYDDLSNSFRAMATRKQAQLSRGARQSRLAKVLLSMTRLIMDVDKVWGGSFGAFLEDFEAGRLEHTGAACGDLLPIPTKVRHHDSTTVRVYIIYTNTNYTTYIKNTRFTKIIKYELYNLHIV